MDACFGIDSAAILIAAFGTQSRIPTNQAPPKRNITLRLISEEIETPSIPRLPCSVSGGDFGSGCIGAEGFLAPLFRFLFLEFTASETGYLSLGIFVSAAIGFALAP
ncbi:MAG: hypothetical protein IPP45_12990 [Sphingomonadales bacterium]|nr:hypothetical protein [Sphingomonadales bacterium]